MVDPAANVVLLTGLPRSGSTLVCHLLSTLPGLVALHEPMKVGAWKGLDRPRVLSEIQAFILESRRTLLASGTAPSKQFEGVVPDNPIEERPLEAGLRKSVVSLGEIAVTKPLAPDFLLAIKHNAAFAALLENLVSHYRCYGIIRNPLALLASWQTVDIPIQQGRIPAAERLNPGLHAELDAIPDRLGRQFHILNWYFGQFEKFLPGADLLRYEELIASRGKSLQSVFDGAKTLDVALTSRNRNPLYCTKHYQEIGQRLLDSDGSYWRFYTKFDVECLLT